MPHRRVLSDPTEGILKQENGHLAPLNERILHDSPIHEDLPHYSPPDDIPTKEQQQEQPATEENNSNHTTAQNGASTSQRVSKPRRMISNYQLTKTLGAGSMGKVKLGVHSVTEEKVAIKIIPRGSSDGSKRTPSAKDESKEIRVAREAAIMTLLNHPNIVKVKEMVIRPHHYYLIMEYVSGGQMLDYIISHGRLKEKHARKFIRQICSAIDYCHRNSVVHRDLKIENILIANDGSIKIIDFGLSNLFSPRSHLSTFCGSLYFAAPELLSAKAYTGPEVDIWSIGIVLYVLVCGKVPFDDQNQPALHAKIKRGHVDYPNWLSSDLDCKHLLSRILVTNPSERANMSEILRHPWISKGYDGPPNNYLPQRSPLQLPLDMDVVRGMSGFEFGDDNHIKEELETIIGSESYQNQTIQSSTFKLPRSFGGYLKKSITTEESTFSHPMVSIYYLVREKMERRRAQQDKSCSSSKTPPIVAKPKSAATRHSSVSNGRNVMSYDTGLEEVRRAAAEYMPHTSSASANERRYSKPATSSTSTETPVKHKRSQSTTGGVFRRISLALRSGREHRQHRDGESNDRERNLNAIPEASIAESSHSQEITSNPTTPMDLSNASERVQRSGSSTLPNRKSKSVWLPSTTASPRRAEEFESRAANQSGSSELFVKPVFLKGLFSVATTSTKKPQVIRADLIRVLNELGYVWRESPGYFECTQKSRSSDDTRVGNSEHTNSITSSKSTDQDEVSSAKSLDNNPNVPKTNPVRFQISIVKMRWLLGLHGLQFSRLSGHPWEYKDACQQILQKLKL
ncbi:Pkinase-domain-containing protein [Basidiobolus meristosporus CBS 931.73]|uniref:non-specific serine/threonine protein kinase n=1 Tax=Basidiobolus meristosporus CBS 931.73 TaxID=1314790 RepID=A0A1Y1YV62_9FUNG|nr:Pkinase-domain-containing protein [Basidiobolus meristosporus CBS 931.73]|eukprot:ORY01928.1 Pkinase-domain-containing protein [Basidiobolus meristosporus CBS 931.73]